MKPRTVNPERNENGLCKPLHFPASASPLDGLKRARASGSSSLIPFPRVGRSVPTDVDGDDGPRLYFGQKRTGKSSLIPFPRVGKKRGGPRAWDLEGGGELRSKKKEIF